MTYGVTSACVGQKNQGCEAVCPVDAFREQETYLVIDPDDCIDCGACIPECPVDAIFIDDELPAEQADYAEINRQLSLQYPVLEESIEPHPEADKYKLITGKKHLI